MSATAHVQRKGGVVDDLIVYCLKEPPIYLVVVNAANRHKDADWMRSHLIRGCHFKDISDEVAQVAPPGDPSPRPFYPNWLTRGTSQPKYYSFCQTGKVAGVDCLISKTGYTGEDGFELYCAPTKLLSCGTPCWMQAKRTASSPAAWAPGHPAVGSRYAPLRPR